MKTILIFLLVSIVQPMSKADDNITVLKRKWALYSIKMEKSGTGGFPPLLDLTNLKKTPQRRENVLYIDKMGEKNIITTKGSNMYMEMLKVSSDTIELAYHLYEPAANKNELIFTAQYVSLPKTLKKEISYGFYFMNNPKDELIATNIFTMGYIGALTDGEYKILQERKILKIDYEYGFTWDSLYVKQKYDLLQKSIFQQRENKSDTETVEDKFFHIVKKAAEVESGIRAITLRQ